MYHRCLRLQNIYKILTYFSMIPLKSMAPVIPKSFAVFFNLKLSECYTKTSMNYSILKKLILKLLGSPGSTSLFFWITFTSFLNMLFMFTFLLPILELMAFTSFIHPKLLTKMSKIFFKAKLEDHLFPLVLLTSVHFWHFCTRYYLLSIFFVTFTSRK